MNNLKAIFSVGTIIALAAIIALIVWVGARQPRYREGVETTEGGYSTIINDEFGYKFTIPHKILGDYQVQRQGYGTKYFVVYDESFAKYTPVFSIVATPKEMAQKFKALCDQDRQTAPFQCTDFEHSDGQNNKYYFNIIGSQDSEFLNGTESNASTLDEIHSAVKQAITFFDVPSTQTLTYSLLDTDGYEYSYPTELDRSFDENMLLTIPESFGLPEFASTTPGLAKIIPVKYCSLSGQCENTTVNFNIMIGSLDISEQDLLKTNIGPSLEKTNISGEDVYTYNEGAEGEGINYFFVVSPVQDQIILIAHKYINEAVVHTYANEKSFTKFAEQKNIVNRIIESLNFKKINK